MITFCNVFIQAGILFLIFFTPIPFGSIDLWAVTIMRVVVGLITLVWLLQVYLERKDNPDRPVLPRTSLNAPLLLGFGFLGLNTFFSVYRYASMWWLYQFITYALLYIVLVHHLQTRQRLIGLVTLLIIAGSLEAFFGIIQYLQGATHLFGREVMRHMVTGTFISRTHTAVYLGMMIPLVVGLLFRVREIEKKFILITLAVIMITSLVLTLSRGGLVSLLLSLVFFFSCMAIHRTDQRQIWLLFVLFLAISIYLSWLGIAPVLKRLGETFVEGQLDSSTLLRLAIWQHSFDLLKTAPLLGTGLGTFQFVFLKYMPYLGETLRAFHAESIYFELLLDAGILGLMLFLWGVIRVFRQALRGYFSSSESSLKLVTLGVLSSCLAFLFHGFVDFNPRIPSNALLFTVILSILMASLQLMGTHVKSRGSKRKDGESGMEDGKARRGISILPPPSSLLYTVASLLIIIFIALAVKSYLAEVYFQQAQVYRKNHQWDEAFEAFQKAIRLEAGNATYHSELGNAYREAGESASDKEAWYTASLQAHTRSVALNPFDPTYRVNLGQVYAILASQPGTEKYATLAMKAFEEAVSLYPNHPFYLQALGRYSFSSGNPSRGTTAYKQALVLDFSKLPSVFDECLLYAKHYRFCEGIVPEIPKARLQFARLLVNKRLWSEAEAEYQDLLLKNQDNLEYYREFANFYLYRKKPLQAILVWQRFLEKDPENIPIRLQIAQTYQNLGKALKAQEEKNTQGRVSDGERKKEEIENWQKALEAYQKIVELDPKEVKAWRGIGDMFIQLKQPEQAVEAYKRELELNPQQPEIHGLLGEIYTQMGKNDPSGRVYNQAVEAYQSAIRLKRNELRYYEGLADVYNLMGKPLEATMIWNKYFDVNPNDVTAHYKLAQYQNQAGNWLDAVREAKIAVSLDSQNASLRSFLASLYLSKDMFYEAAQQWEAVVQGSPKDVGARFQLAALYEKLFQFSKAQSQYQAILSLQPDNTAAQQKLKKK
jgi:tetratricopeptide (TPR) repeat protein